LRIDDTWLTEEQCRKESDTFTENDLLAFPESSDDLGAIVTDEAGLESHLLLRSGGINDRDGTLIAALANR
jgi:hypothetical protein